MSKKVTLAWESVQSTINGETVPAFSIKRAKVPGGWLVRESTPKSLSMIFMPDENYQWVVEEELKEGEEEKKYEEEFYALDEDVYIDVSTGEDEQ